MALDISPGQELWRKGKEADHFSRNTRLRVSLLEKLLPLNEPSQLRFSEQLHQGGNLLDFGPGSGETGALIARHANMQLLQVDVSDYRSQLFVQNEPSTTPMTIISKDAPTHFTDHTAGKVDNILICDTLHHVGYKGYNQPQAQLRLLYELLPLLNSDGKILVATLNTESTIIENVMELVSASPVLKHRVLFY